MIQTSPSNRRPQSCAEISVPVKEVYVASCILYLVFVLNFFGSEKNNVNIPLWPMGMHLSVLEVNEIALVE